MCNEPTYSEAIFNIFLVRVLKEKEVIKNICNGKYSNINTIRVYCGGPNIKEVWKLNRCQ